MFGAIEKLCPWTALVVALALAPAGAGAAEDGLNITITGAVSPQYAAAVNALQPHWVRIFVGWYGVEPSPNSYNEAVIANIEEAIAQLPAGTKVDLDLVGTPAWATAGGQGATTAPPADPATFASFAGHLATELGSRVTAYEIWNEEDSSAYWTGTVPQYVGLLEAAYPAIKAANPSATVVLGGLVGNDYDYLGEIYTDGAEGAFDAVGVHTDTACNITSPFSYLRDATGQIDRYSFLGYHEVHAVMTEHGDGGKPIWMTEMGWNTSTGICQNGLFAGQKASGVSEASQATFLSQGYHCLAADPYVQVAMWYAFQDAGSADSAIDRYGLVRSDFSHKPAWDAFLAYSEHGDQLGGACGNFVGPTITIIKPVNGHRYTGTLPISVRATSPAGVPRITLEHDGMIIRNFTDRSAPTVLTGTMTWFGAKHISLGKHVITALAKDPQGNVSSVSVTVIHAAAKPKKKHHKHHRARRRR